MVDALIPHERSPPAIGDYALIGDCRSAALVSRGGSIDWLCWPRFDSPSIFGALLDPDAGYWRIAPAEPSRARRRYIGDTNVLETRFATAGGVLRLIDLMPVASEEERRRLQIADHEVLRIVECDAGEVAVEMELVARPGYGRRVPSIRAAGPLGLRIDLDPGLLVLRSDQAVAPGASDSADAAAGRVRRRARLRAGQSLAFSLTFEDEWPAVLPPVGAWSRDCLARSLAWWSAWTARMNYDGPYRAAVARSALTLRLMLHAPSGAFVAAPTTSLPERVAGPMNWDYRFCWLRDASLTIRALLELGFRQEGEALLGWLLHTTRLTRPELRVLYDVYGRVPPRERTLPHLTGYRDSRPVRIGNGAAGQLQLDVYGEVLDAAAQFAVHGGSFDRETRRLLCGFGAQVARSWREPDEGIWEPRSGRRENTHSHLLCWVALDRLIMMHQRLHVWIDGVDDLTRAREQIACTLRERAWSPALGSYVATLGGSDLDASTLLMSWYGFEEAGGERMRGTYARLTSELGAGRGLFFRYRNGESPGEGAFGVCGFWGVEYLALGGGTVEAARAAFEQQLAFENDVGLYAEEIDPATGAALGNFPQAFTHIGLINAALSLQRRAEGRVPLRRSVPMRPVATSPATELP